MRGKYLNSFFNMILRFFFYRKYSILAYSFFFGFKHFELSDFFGAFNILCFFNFENVELATSFNYSYLNFIVSVCNEFNDN
jgi:hypothetical protein